MKMTTTTRHPFGGGFRSPGDTFDAENENEAATLESLGWATRADHAPPKPAAKAPAKAAKKAAKNTYNTRALKSRK